MPMVQPSPPLLGRLERVELRNAWLGEATSFTPWLATPDNIVLLGEAIGIELEVDSQEKDVGRILSTNQAFEMNVGTHTGIAANVRRVPAEYGLAAPDPAPAADAGVGLRGHRDR